MTLQAHHVSAGHDGAPVLTGLDFAVEPGRVTGLTGPSGGGKTTLARVLAGLHRPSGGHVTLDGDPLPTTPGGEVALLYQSPRQAVTPRWTLARIIAEPLHRRPPRPASRRSGDTSNGRSTEPPPRRGAGFSRSRGAGFSRSGGAGFSLGRGVGFSRSGIAGFSRSGGDDRDETVRSAARRVGLTDDLLDRRPHQVSDGQLQRACLARALVQRPRYLICDEMTAMLDPATTASLTAVVTEQARAGLGVLAISHHLALLEVWSDVRFALSGDGLETLA